MSEFWIYSEIGLHHVLDIEGYDHILFLIALTVPYAFKDWRRILILVSVFTLGHTLALVLSVFGIVTIKSSLVEFLIPLTILITALYNIFTAGKAAKAGNINLAGFLTLFFGLIHGLGFSNYFKTILPGNASEKMVPLLEFAVGIEAAQIVVVAVVLILSFAFQNLSGFSKRDFILVFSAFAAGVAVPMIIESEVWLR